MPGNQLWRIHGQTDHMVLWDLRWFYHTKTKNNKTVCLYDMLYFTVVNVMSWVPFYHLPRLSYTFHLGVSQYLITQVIRRFFCVFRRFQFKGFLPITEILQVSCLHCQISKWFKSVLLHHKYIWIYNRNPIAQQWELIYQIKVIFCKMFKLLFIKMYNKSPIWC